MIPEIRQIIKTQEDDAVRAKFNPEELKKALIGPSLTTQEKVNLVERAKQQIKEEMSEKKPATQDVLAARENKPAPAANVSGEGFTMKNEAATKSDYNVKFELAPNIRDLAKLQTDEISADLEYLANKHPEMFNGRPADAFRLIREIKENPTHFYANNRLDYGLIVKRLDGNKIGKLAVEKKTGDIKHATKVNDKDLKRLEKISKEKLGNAGIIQTFTRPGSKLENQGLGYQTTGIISQSSQKVKELSPAELRKAIINAKDDKERLAIIENQKAGIRQRLEDEAVGDKPADKLAKEAQILADNKPAEKKFTLETIKSFDPRKHGHAYLSKISFNDRKPVREFIDSNTRMWDNKRKYYETSYTFNAKEGDMFETRLDDGSWKSDLRDYYIVKKDDKGELYLSRAKELSDLQKEAVKEAETKSEWETKILSSANVEKLNKIMRDIEHTEAITPNNRAKLYVAITNRLKELREARK